MKDDFASGNPNNAKSSTSKLDRATGSLEQLPPTKKRDLRTSALSYPQTESSAKPEVHSEPPKMAQPEPPRPEPRPAPRPEPPRVELPRAAPPVERKAEPVAKPEPEVKPLPNLLAEGRTAEIEMGRVTTNHQVSKDPSPPSPPAPPVKQAVPEPPRENPTPIPQVFVAPVASYEQHTAKTEAVAQPLPQTEPVGYSYSKSKPDIPVSAGEVQLFGSFGYVETPSNTEPRQSTLRSLAWPIVCMVLLLGTAAAIVVYVPNLRTRFLPVRIASMLGYETNITPMVSIQEYRISLDEKENSATIRGVVKNLSEATVGPVQVELLLSRREDVRVTETRLIPIDPSQLGPNQEGKYELKISAKDYQQTKVSRVLSGENALKVKKLKEIIDPQPQIDPSQVPSSQASTSQAPRPDPNQVYDGSVSFK
jgi:hypothetical protein